MLGISSYKEEELMIDDKSSPSSSIDSSSDDTSCDEQNENAHPQQQLAVRCKIPRCYGISRQVGIKWLDSARYGDVGVVRSLLADCRGTRNHNNDHTSEQIEQHQLSTIETHHESSAAMSAMDRLLHYNGQGTSYGFIGSTALHWAAANGDIPMMKLLLRHGAGVDVQNLGGSTPLHSAAAHNNFTAVSLLLLNGADPTAVDVCGDTPEDVLMMLNQTNDTTAGAADPYYLFNSFSTKPDAYENFNVNKLDAASVGYNNNADGQDGDGALELTRTLLRTHNIVRKLQRTHQSMWRASDMKAVLHALRTSTRRLGSDTKQDAANSKNLASDDEPLPLDRAELVTMVNSVLDDFSEVVGRQERISSMATALHAKGFKTLAERHRKRMMKKKSGERRKRCNKAQPPEQNKQGRQTPITRESGDKMNEFKTNDAQKTAPDQEEVKVKAEEEEEDAAKEDDDEDSSLLKHAEAMKERGNTSLRNGDIKGAIRLYTAALGILGPAATTNVVLGSSTPDPSLSNVTSTTTTSHGGVEAPIPTAAAAAQQPDLPHRQLAAILYSNRCHAYLKQQDSSSHNSGGIGGRGGEGGGKGGGGGLVIRALEDAQMAVALRPQWDKGYRRVACCARRLGRPSDAVIALRCALEQVPVETACIRPRSGGSSTDIIPTEESKTTPATDATEAQIRVELREAEAEASALGEKVGGGPSSFVSGEAEEATTAASSMSSGMDGIKKADPSSSLGKKVIHPWFDCLICENKTRDKAETPCCGRVLCGTCLRRRWGSQIQNTKPHCPFPECRTSASGGTLGN